MTDDYYTPDNMHLLKASKMATWRHGDAKLTSAKVQMMDRLITGELTEPISVVTPSGANSFLPKYIVSGYSPGVWTEMLYFQTGMQLYPSMGVCVTTHTRAEVTSVTCVAASALTTSDYFFIDCVDGAGDTVKNYVWFQIDAAGADPAPGGTGIEVDIVNTDTAAQVATKLKDKIDAEGNYGASVVTTVVTITNAAAGATEDAYDYNTDFTISTTTQGVSTHTMGIRTTQTPTNQGRHWERENTTDAESERIDILGMLCRSHHIECSEAQPVGAQILNWGCGFTKNTATDDIARSQADDEPFRWNNFTFSVLLNDAGSTALEADIIGWAFDIQNSIMFIAPDSNGYYQKGKYVPQTTISTTLEIMPYGHNAYELIRTKLGAYTTDLDVTVTATRTATYDKITWTHDKCYCFPFTIKASKDPGSVERYFLRMVQLDTGSIVPVVVDYYPVEYYET